MRLVLVENIADVVGVVVADIVEVDGMIEDLVGSTDSGYNHMAAASAEEHMIGAAAEEHTIGAAAVADNGFFAV